MKSHPALAPAGAAKGERPCTTATDGPSLQDLSASAPPAGSGGKRLFVTVVTVRSRRHPYGRGDDQRVVREHEGREGHADEVEGEHLHYAVDRGRGTAAIAGDLGRGADRANRRRRPVGHGGAVCAAPRSGLSVFAAAHRGRGPGRGPRDRGISRRVASRQPLRRAFRGIDLGAGHRPLQGALGTQASRRRAARRGGRQDHRGSGGRSGDRAGEERHQHDHPRMFDAAGAASSRDHRPRLLPREVAGRGRRDRRRPEKHRQDPNAARPHPTGGAAQERRDRARLTIARRSLPMSPTYRAHPEFGYFCPSRSFRRKLLATLVVIALGTLASVVVVGGSRVSRDDASPPPAPADAASSSAATASVVDQATATAARPGSAERPKPVCEGETWTYLDGKCIAGKAPKPRIAAIETPPIAAVPLGRTAPPPAATQPPAKAERAGEAAAAPPAPKPERVAEADAAPPSKSQRATDAAALAPVAAATAPAAAEPAVQSSSAFNERRKASRDRASRDERRSARVASSDHRKAKSATGWTKQVRSAEQFMRVLFSAGI